MLFNLPYLVAWETIKCKHQCLVNDANYKENAKHIDHDYTIAEKVLMPFPIVQVNINCTVSTHHGCITEYISIRRFNPYFE